MSEVADLQHTLCYILNDVCALLMKSRHSISITIYTTEWGMLLAPMKMKCSENSFGEPAKRNETRPWPILLSGHHSTLTRPSKFHKQVP